MSMYSRTERMLGAETVEKIKAAGVAVFGLGGVGSYAAEALVRAGVGRLLFVDGDVVDETNLNRQLIATRDTIGRPKAEVARERALSINPAAEIQALRVFYDEANPVDISGYGYIADCIDSVKSKLLLIENGLAAGSRVISCMGAGNKLDPMGFEVADISKTCVCPLAKVMRRELKARGIEHLPVVFSREKPYCVENGARTPGSNSFAPAAAGLALAGWVIRDIAGAEAEY